MKILHITPAFYPSTRFGGPAVDTYENARRQAKEGYEVFVYTTDIYLDERIMRNKLTNVDGVKVIYFKNYFFLKRINPHYFYSMGLVKKLRETIHEFDIVHLHDSRTIVNYAASKMCKKENIPYVIQTDGTLRYFNRKILLKRVFDFFFTKFILENCSRILILTENEREDFQKFNLPKERFETIPNGVDLLEYSQLPEKGVFRKKHGIKNNEKLILFLSRINERKGLHELINAFENLKIADARLVVAGNFEGCSSRYKREIENKIKQNNKVTYVGFLNEEGKKEAFTDSDLFVLLAHHEPFGMVFLEAMACNCPILTYSDVCLA